MAIRCFIAAVCLLSAQLSAASASAAPSAKEMLRLHRNFQTDLGHAIAALDGTTTSTSFKTQAHEEASPIAGLSEPGEAEFSEACMERRGGKDTNYPTLDAAWVQTSQHKPTDECRAMFVPKQASCPSTEVDTATWTGGNAGDCCANDSHCSGSLKCSQRVCSKPCTEDSDCPNEPGATEGECDKCYHTCKSGHKCNHASICGIGCMSYVGPMSQSLSMCPAFDYDKQETPDAMLAKLGDFCAEFAITGHEGSSGQCVKNLDNLKVELAEDGCADKCEAATTSESSGIGLDTLCNIVQLYGYTHNGRTCAAHILEGQAFGNPTCDSFRQAEPCICTTLALDNNAEALADLRRQCQLCTDSSDIVVSLSAAPHTASSSFVVLAAATSAALMHLLVR